MTRLALVRHGQSTWNAERRLQGQADPPLTREGEAQAAAAAGLLQGLSIERAVCSDLQRARLSAVLMGYPEAQPDPRWREVDVGAWGGRSIDDLQAEDPQVWRAWRAGEVTPPGGESWSAFRHRLRETLGELDGQGGVLVVTHGGVIRAALSVLLDVPADQLAPVPPASLTLVETGAWPRLRIYGAAPARGFDAPD